MTSLIVVFLRPLLLYAALMVGAVLALSSLLASLEGRVVDGAAVAPFAPLIGALAAWAAERRLAREGVFRAWAACGGRLLVWRLTVLVVVGPGLALGAWWSWPDPVAWWTPLPDGWLVEVNGLVLGRVDEQFCASDPAASRLCPPTQGPRLPVVPVQRGGLAAGLGVFAAVAMAEPARPGWVIVLCLLLAGGAVVLAA